MPKLGAALDFSQLEAIRLRAHQNNGAPVSPAPVAGQIYYDTGANTLYFYNGSTWVSASGGTPSDATAGAKGIIQLAGDLAGTAAAPQIAAGAVVDADVNGSAAIAESKLSLATDAAAGTGSRRTLGPGATQAMPGNTRLDQVNAPTASVNLNSQKITSLLDPTGAQDAATKNYVDLLQQGLDSHPSVKAASTANLALSGTQTVDGIALVANDRILVKDQTTQAQNGIYVVAAGAWTRATDQDTWGEVPSAYVWVEQGTTQADSGWVCTADQGGTLNTTAITWILFASAGQLEAGNGLIKTGNQFDVNTDNSTVEVSADVLRVKDLGITNAKLAGSIDLTAKVTGALPIANGGTGQTAQKTARETGLAAAGYYTNGATHGAGATITITQATHGLRSSRGIIVQVQDEATGNVELPDISIAANGDVTVTYGASLTANTKRVTLVG
jgi:Repeat of unknown function (DUF5907)